MMFEPPTAGAGSVDTRDARQGVVSERDVQSAGPERHIGGAASLTGMVQCILVPMLGSKLHLRGFSAPFGRSFARKRLQILGGAVAGDAFNQRGAAALGDRGHHFQSIILMIQN